VGEQPNGRIYVETEVGGKKLQATVDIGMDIMYMAKESLMRLAYLTKWRRAT